MYPKTIILLGGPGSGKGTQGKKIEKVYDYFHLSMGDIMRETNNHDVEIYNKELSSKKYSNLTHELSLCLLKNAMVQKGWTNQNFVIDGFHRKFDIFDLKFISEIHIVCVLVFCPKSIDLLRSRIETRYKENGNFRKSDLEILEKRLKIYETETQEVIKFFKESFEEKVYFIDCENSIENVFFDIQTILDKILAR